MNSVHKKRITFLSVILLCFVCVCFNKTEAYAVTGNNYLVLIQQKDGSWKEYTNLIEVSGGGNLMIKAKRISKALGYSYEKSKNDTFVIKKDVATYNTYTKNVNEFIYTNGSEEITMMAAEMACASKQSEYNLCTISSLNPLVNYKCFNSTAAEEYSDYDGVVCFSKYKEIPTSVPIVELKPAKEPTKAPVTELSTITIEGVEFPVRDSFLTIHQALSDWGGTTTWWSNLEQEYDGKIIESTNLWFDSNTIEFSHQGVGCEGVSLTKGKNGYRLSISVKLNGSVIAEQNASVVKAMVATISSKPMLVYEAIFDSFTSTETHGINQDTYVIIGDCKLKVNIKDGIVTYYILKSN